MELLFDWKFSGNHLSKFLGGKKELLVHPRVGREQDNHSLQKDDHAWSKLFFAIFEDKDNRISCKDKDWSQALIITWVKVYISWDLIQVVLGKAVKR